MDDPLVWSCLIKVAAAEIWLVLNAARSRDSQGIPRNCTNLCISVSDLSTEFWKGGTGIIGIYPKYMYEIQWTLAMKFSADFGLGAIREECQSLAILISEESTLADRTQSSPSWPTPTSSASRIWYCHYCSHWVLLQEHWIYTPHSSHIHS